MITFEVNDMRCGHCVGAITQALKIADSEAAVRIDLATHRVEIGSASADAARLGDAIRQAGYTPVPVESIFSRPVPQAKAQRRGCCCG